MNHMAHIAFRPQFLLVLIRKNMVLTISAVVAIVTMVVVPPDAAYLGYMDWNTLGCLFCVLAVANAFRYLGAFDRAARLVIEHFDEPRQVVMALVLTTGALSMIATNDLALIILLPLSATILTHAGWTRFIAPAFVMQGLAANLCGMILPFGNPQNLYLYSYYSPPLLEFLKTMMMPFLLSVVMIVICTLILTLSSVSVPEHMDEVSKLPLGRRRFAAYSLLLALTILAVFRMFPVLVSVIACIAVLAYADRRALKAVDYPLLLTFICFFVFAGNMARMPLLSDSLTGLMAANGLLASAGLSQIISNVPSAVLLSHFTGDWQSLLLGVNIGGAGTLIGSLASLITLQYFISVVRVFPQMKNNPDLSVGRFLKLFILLNFGFLIALLLACFFCTI